jgi:hypothetical protein
MTSDDERFEEASLHLDNLLMLWKVSSETLLALPEPQRKAMARKIRELAGMMRDRHHTSSSVFTFIADSLETGDSQP